MRMMAIICFGAILASGALHAQPAGTLPAIHGTALDGASVDLPDALRGKVGVLVVGFSQASREQVTAWGKELAGDYRQSAAVAYYEIPVLADVPRLLRGLVVRKIADSVPDRAKPRFLPVYEHEAELKMLSGYTKADDAYVLLVDGSGQVRWKLEGPVTATSHAELLRQVEALRR